ncbi:helix-turn-helix domain-containing protein [Streptomyces sp. NBC_00490]|uniref:helix-turn-helix domain-containing protein n=1 Tax=Streptomyces sp. NBC_00490 TaxID=2903657 RepID=UPI002E17443F
MPKNLHVELTDDQRRDLRELLGRRGLARHTRLRADCVRLLDWGRTVTEVDDLLECNPVTVRGAVHRFEKGGLDALPDAPRPGRHARILNPEDRAELVDPLDGSAAAGVVTWTTPPCVTGSATSRVWKPPRPRRLAEVAQPAGIRLAQGAWATR